MPGVLFYHEPEHIDVFSGHDVSLDAWNYAIKAAGDIDRCVIVDRVGNAQPFDGALPIEIVGDISDWSPDGPYCAIDVPWSSNPGVPLWSFDHNVAWYCFGPASGWQDASSASQIVHVPQAGQAALHSVHIGSVVMLHRFHVIGGA